MHDGAVRCVAAIEKSLRAEGGEEKEEMERRVV